MIVAWPKHLRVNCSRDKDGYLSNNCAGGSCWCSTLFLCKRCGGGEGSLPTDCPGERMTAEEKDLVYAEKLNYIRNRGWVTPDSIHFKAN